MCTFEKNQKTHFSQLPHFHAHLHFLTISKYIAGAGLGAVGDEEEGEPAARCSRREDITSYQQEGLVPFVSE